MGSATQVVILNGVSSVGKTSIAKALQRIAAEPFLNVSMDAFLDMLPERTLNHPDGITFEAVYGASRPTVAVRTGPVVERALTGMRHAVSALADRGNNLIVDEVMFGAVEEEEYRRLLQPFDVLFVGIFASLEVIEERERLRGDREIGLARWQFDLVHRDRAYDLRVDTTHMTPDAAALKIKTAFGL